MLADAGLTTSSEFFVPEVVMGDGNEVVYVLQYLGGSSASCNFAREIYAVFTRPPLRPFGKAGGQGQVEL